MHLASGPNVTAPLPHSPLRQAPTARYGGKESKNNKMDHILKISFFFPHPSSPSKELKTSPDFLKTLRSRKQYYKSIFERMCVCIGAHRHEGSHVGGRTYLMIPPPSLFNNLKPETIYSALVLLLDASFTGNARSAMENRRERHIWKPLRT